MASYRSSSSDDSNDAKEPAETTEATNVFRNDGSFLEMFKKMQKAAQSSGNRTPVGEVIESPIFSKVEDKCEKEPPPITSSNKPTPFIGRRRSTKALPVGKVKKLKTENEDNKASPTDAWAKYLEEVKKYKETYCDSEAKNRSLVK